MKAKIKFYLSCHNSIAFEKPYWYIYAKSVKNQKISTSCNQDNLVRDLAKDYVPPCASGTLKLEFEKCSGPTNRSFTVIDKQVPPDEPDYEYTIKHNELKTHATLCSKWFNKIFGEGKVGDVWTLTKVVWEPKL